MTARPRLPAVRSDCSSSGSCPGWGSALRLIRPGSHPVSLLLVWTWWLKYCGWSLRGRECSLLPNGSGSPTCRLPGSASTAAEPAGPVPSLHHGLPARFFPHLPTPESPRMFPLSVPLPTVRFQLKIKAPPSVARVRVRGPLVARNNPFWWSGKICN